MQQERILLWNQVCRLEGEPLQQVKSVYDPKFFPIEFRHYFAEMIESEDWPNLNPDNLNHIPQAKGRRGEGVTCITCGFRDSEQMDS